MRKEYKLYIPERLKNRIRILAKEKGLSMNELGNRLLEDAIYKLMEEEKKYGEVKSK